MIKEEGKTKEMEKILKKNQGITLVALVVTIIVLVILATVSIGMVLGNGGIFKQAEEAKKLTANAQVAEEEGFNKLYEQLAGYLTGGNEVKEETANSPKQIEGLTPIKFTNPTESAKGSYETTTWNDSNWYDYKSQRWANAVSQDGSMWVWIPRYAYQISYTDGADKSKGGSISVKFLNDKTDSYYETDKSLQTAKRAKTAEEIVDTTTGYTVHPAFTNETAIEFQNGGWKEELAGIWVAKFEAGYASGNNSAPVVASSMKYTQTTGWGRAIEAGTASDSTVTARNWLDGIYGTTETSIKYPTFQGVTYSMNYINHNDVYNISRHLTDSGNIYGFTNTTTDSHLMKNSEWGAVAYLSQSSYGLNGTEATINNISLNSGNQKRTEIAGKNGVDSVYAVTGCTTGSTTEGEKQTTIDKIKGTTGNTANTDGVYTWDQLKGTTASSTGNITGIYDLSGGTWERSASYVNNGNANLVTYGNSLLQGKSTEYTTIYPHNSTTDSTSITSNEANLNTASTNNYKTNTKIYGNAIRETSTTGLDTMSWNSDYSYFAGLGAPFFLRGGYLWHGASTGLFCFNRDGGASGYHSGFRPVLVAH